MKKLLSLIKVSLSYDMNLFRINSKKQSKFTKVLIPIIISFYLMIVIGAYAFKIMEMLKPVHMEYVGVSLFAFVVTIITLMEGIYKSSSLLFNCKDDNLLLSLPIKRSTVLFIRIFKFYVFELLYNSMFLIPAIGVYAYFVHPGWTYYLSSLVALLILPIVPIVLSCIIGFIITFLSSKFKGKNIIQTVFTTLFLLAFLYLTYNSDGFITDIAKKATSINELITRLYYPVGAYISLITDFNIKTLIIYVFVNLLLFVAITFILGKVYFKINSGFKRVLISNKSNKGYSIKSNTKAKAFIKKELNKFISTPVFVTNTGFGLVLFIIACIMCSIRFDSIAGAFIKTNPTITMNYIKASLPVVMLMLVSFASFMTSITSSMISLEGKTISLLKSLPIRPISIVLYKVISSLIIMIPCIIVGDIIIFIRFNFNIISIILILIASILLPLISELIGIIMNLKYPKMDATNDTEIVKQSMSSIASTFIGIGLLGITIIILFFMLNKGIDNYLIMLIYLLFSGIICLLLWLLLVKTCDKNFNNINT